MASLATKVPPPVLALVTGVFMWILGRVGLGGPSIDALGLDIAGLAIALAGIAVAVLGLREFNRAGTTFDPHRIDETSALVTTGPYRLTRNPMYLGLLGVLVGWGLVLGELVSSIAGPFVFVAMITVLQIRPEEAMMASLFGVDYDDYRRRVRRWV